MYQIYTLGALEASSSTLLSNAVTGAVSEFASEGQRSSRVVCGKPEARRADSVARALEAEAVGCVG